MSMTDFYQRRAGVLLHPTSLPSGKLDEDAERWLDWLEQSGFSVWQVLPLGEPQHGLCPYQCVSAFAMNPALYTDYGTPRPDLGEFRIFCAANPWVEDYALFKLLHDRFDDDAWYEWPDEYKYRDEEALTKLRKDKAHEYLALQWQQYQLHQRWFALKQQANDRNILLFGDMPLFVAHDSVDVWVEPKRFLLDEKGIPSVVTGVPPDYFSETGQRWGNPHFNWDYMRNEHYAWWLQRMQYHLEMFDTVRIDHFRGLQASWVISAECETAIDGHWETMPGDELLTMLQKHIGTLPIVAEDLGIITPEVTALRKKFNLPGMSVLQFGFDAFEDNPHKPQNIVSDKVVYTGTHDNDTTRGWYESLAPDVQVQVRERLGVESSADNEPACVDIVVDKMIVMAMQTQASLCMIPMQDILHLDSSARMNVPGTIDTNWEWAFEWQQLERVSVVDLRQLIEKSDRLVDYDI